MSSSTSTNTCEWQSAAHPPCKRNLDLAVGKFCKLHTCNNRGQCLEAISTRWIGKSGCLMPTKKCASHLKQDRKFARNAYERKRDRPLSNNPVESHRSRSLGPLTQDRLSPHLNISGTSSSIPQYRALEMPQHAEQDLQGGTGVNETLDDNMGQGEPRDFDGSDTENIDTNTDQAISHARSPPHSGPPTSFNQPTLPTQQLKDVLRPLHPDSIFPPINTDHLVPPPHPSQLPPAVPAPFTKIKGSNPGQMVVGGKVEIEIDWNFLGKKDGEMEILEFTSTGGRERWRIPLLSKRVYKSNDNLNEFLRDIVHDVERTSESRSRSRLYLSKESYDPVSPSFRAFLKDDSLLAGIFPQSVYSGPVLMSDSRYDVWRDGELEFQDMASFDVEHKWKSIQLDISGFEDQCPLPGDGQQVQALNCLNTREHSSFNNPRPHTIGHTVIPYTKRNQGGRKAARQASTDLTRSTELIRSNIKKANGFDLLTTGGTVTVDHVDGGGFDTCGSLRCGVKVWFFGPRSSDGDLVRQDRDVEAVVLRPGYDFYLKAGVQHSVWSPVPTHMTGFHALHPDSITLCAETRRIEHKVNLSNETLPFVTILLADLAMQIKSGQWDGLYCQGNEGDQRDKRESLRIIEEMVRNRGEYEPSAVDKTHNSDDLALIRAMDLVWTVMGPFIQSRKKDLGL